MRAFYRRDARQATAALDELISTTRSLGFERLPGPSAAAAAAAQRAAREGDRERAVWALEAAEALDPGRPETAFAGAEVAWRGQSYGKAVLRWFGGWWRTLKRPDSRSAVLAGSLYWVVATILLAGALFILLEMILRGPRLHLRLSGLWPSGVPAALWPVLTIGILLWPLLLPGRVFWLLAWWGALLWSQMGGSERGVLVTLWLVALVAPMMLGSVGAQSRFSTRSGVLGLRALQAERLAGDLFGNLEAAKRESSREQAWQQVEANLQRRLGEWEAARRLYLEVLEADPDNYVALSNLGVYHYRLDDRASAWEYFQRAVEAAPAVAVTHFNLSQVVADAYLFRDAERLLKEARRLAPGQVSRWIHSSSWNRVVPVDETEGQIVKLEEGLWRQSGLGAVWSVRRLREGLPDLLLVASWVLLAMGLDRLLPQTRRPARARGRGVAGEYGGPGWVRRLPAATAIRDAAGWGAWSRLLLPAAIAAVVVVQSSVPALGLAPGVTGPGPIWFAVAAGVVYVVVMVLGSRR